MKRKLLALLTALIAVWLYRNFGGIIKDDLIITLVNGQLRGKDNGYYYSYEAIPYAEAPVGKLRFESPLPYQQKWGQEFDATQKPKPCMQWNQYGKGDDKLMGVEDCLTVSVYKPKTNHTNYPVMVHFHGGCFMFGDVNLYGEELLMKHGHMLLVKVTYRLGPLGFLSTEDDIIPGNFGLKDQQLALLWIKENIAQFGGDPEKILLTGFSAGAAATHLHLLNPKSAEIPKAAVSFSGVALNPWVITKNPQKNALKMAKLMKCPHTSDSMEIKNCLQSKSAEEIVSSVKYFLHFGYNPFTTFGPVIESKVNNSQAFMTQHPRDIIKSGNFLGIPFLASFTQDDGGYNAAELLQISPKTGREYIYDLNEHWLALAPKNLFLENTQDRPQEYAKKLRRKYLGENGFSLSNYPKIQRMYTDVLFKNGVVETLNLHRQYGHGPVYGYVYDNPADYGLGQILSLKNDFEFGTVHLDDFSLILNVTDRSPFRNDELIISDKLIQMMVDFVENGKLSFGDCDFEKINSNSKDSNILSITKNDCHVITVK